MLSLFSYLKRLFAYKWVRFEKLLENIHPTYIVTEYESNDKIIITFPLDEWVNTFLRISFTKRCESEGRRYCISASV